MPLLSANTGPRSVSCSRISDGRGSSLVASLTSAADEWHAIDEPPTTKIPRARCFNKLILATHLRLPTASSDQLRYRLRRLHGSHAPFIHLKPHDLHCGESNARGRTRI